MDKYSVEYKDLMRKIDELTKDAFALAGNDVDANQVSSDLLSIRLRRGDEAKQLRQEAEEKVKIGEASLECKEKLIDLISTYITEVNPTSGDRARRTLIENYANLTIKMMKDNQSALYVAKRRDPQASKEAPVGNVEAMIGMLATTNSTSSEDAETTKSNMNAAVENAASLLRDAFNNGGTKVDDAMLRAWVRRL